MGKCRRSTIHEVKARLSSILHQIENSGETFMICRENRPIAQLVPYGCRNRLKYHSTLNKIKIDYNPIEDLSKDEWLSTDDK
jgi:antitoxin (DNA-binding transcriptional repressor) of toxin-antitoxin stability system